MSAVTGARPVARLEDLPPVEARAVLCLRAWSEDATGASRTLRTRIADWVAPDRSPAWCQNFDALVATILAHARRPPSRHAGECPCVGADEAVFAHFAHLAAIGEREDAMMIATLLVRADVVPAIVDLAQKVGLGLMPAAVPQRPVMRLH